MTSAARPRGISCRPGSPRRWRCRSRATRRAAVFDRYHIVNERDKTWGIEKLAALRDQQTRHVAHGGLDADGRGAVTAEESVKNWILPTRIDKNGVVIDKPEGSGDG